jgi:protein tyrosine phosphatase (PTP) superfamily phosphohydrolase (DUF442 family)
MNRLALLAAVSCLGCWCSLSAEEPPAAGAAGASIRKIDSKRLPNAYRLNDRVISGGLPDGEAAFAELRALGVRTVISVDGARPDVAAAKKHGLRYVHLPHGYDGIPDDRILELAKAVQELPGPVYIHCHHGKHRSPAAAAATCVSLGLLSNDDALGVLKTAGTSPNYRGLYDTVATAHRADPAALAKLPAEFRETVDVPPLAEAMIAIEHIHDRLKLSAEAKWKAPPKHPDVDPPHEALLLREQFTELLRTDMLKQEPAKFVELTRLAEKLCGELETALRDAPGDAKRATNAFAQVTSNCQACHTAFRDVPLREKGGTKAGPH